MELYLDSANLTDIKTAFELKFLTGLTTTPTFMHREGIENIDNAILELSQLVPILQIEALGRDANQIITEAKRLLELGLDPAKTVFKIPVSLEGVKACDAMINQGMLVNIHLIYTVQQAYMAVAAGATYICPLIGRLQDQGQDALGLTADCVDLVEKYDYDTKVMFSSVRNKEHVKNAIQIGVHACTIPWKIIKTLTENYFTAIGTKEFFEHTNLITIKVADVIKHKPAATLDTKVVDGLIEMTKSKLGAVAIIENDEVLGIFTDGDLRRTIELKGQDYLNQTFRQFDFKPPISINPQATLNDAWELLRQHKIDTLIVSKDKKYYGMLDAQDLIEIISAA